MQKLVWQNGNGDVLEFTGNYAITDWEGFANAPLNIQSQQVPFQDGGVFLDALIEKRSLSVTLAMYDGGNLEERYRMQRELIHALNPKSGEGYLIYTNNYISKRIKCVAQIPLFKTHNSNESGTPKASLSWTACDPYWEDVEETEIVINAEEIVNIKNEGDVPCQVTVDLYNIDTKSISVKNLTNEKKVKLEGDYNGIIKISTETGNKKIETEITKADTIFVQNSFAYACYDTYREQYVFAGNNIIAMTKDFKTFKVYATEYNINKIFYFPETNRFIATGTNFVISSTDAINWTDVGVNYNLTDVIYENEKYYGFIISGNNTLVFSSTDSLEWESNTVTDIKLKSVVYVEDLHLFVGITDYSVYTSPDFLEWTLRNTFTSYDNLKKIYYIKGANIVIVGHYTSYSSGSPTDYLRCYYSSNSLNWFQSSMTEEYRAYGVDSLISGIRSRGFYIVNNTRVYNSITGTYWEKVETRNKTYDKFLRFDALGDFMLFSSSTVESLITEQVRLENIENIKDIAYSKKLQRYVMITSSSIYVSSNKIIWTKVADKSDLLEIVYVEEWEKFFITCIGNGIYYTSTDGIEWSTHNTMYGMYIPNQIKYISELKKIFVGGRGVSTTEGRILYSTDGNVWKSGSNTDIPPTRLEEILSVVYSAKHNRLLAVGASNSLYAQNLTYYSDDGGEKWNYTGPTPEPKSMFYVRYMEKVFLPSASTENGLSWIRLNNLSLEDFCYSDDFAFFIGYISNGTGLLISYNCQEWRALDLNLKSEVQFEKIRYIEAEKKFYLIGRIPSINDIYTIVELKIETGNNIISEMSINSDMSLGLEVGNNEIRINCPDGYILGKLSFRQKYIGV